MNKRITSVLDGSNKEASERLEKIIEKIDKDKSQISTEGDCCSLIDNRLHLTFLDSLPEEEDRIVNEFLDSLSEEEKERAMSSEFDYLDEDLID